MSDLSPTTAHILPTATTTYIDGVYGEAIASALMPLYRAADGTYKKCVDDTAEHARMVAMSMHPGGAGQPARMAGGGGIEVTDSLFTPGMTYMVSDTAGGLRPFADEGSGDFLTAAVIATSDHTCDLYMKALEIAKA